VVRALDAAARTDVGWQDRFGVLRDHVLARMPVLVLLDNFEDNHRWFVDEIYLKVAGV
jgi:hypothetical protein